MQKGEISVFACRGIYSGGLMEILERTLRRAHGDVGLDLRALQGLVPALLPMLKRLHRTFDEAGQVFLPKRASWIDEFRTELLAFPYGRYDDQVDALSQLLNWIDWSRRNRATCRSF